MKHYVGLDVSLETTAICVIDDQGRTLEMTSVSSDPHAIAKILRRRAKKVVRIVLESGQLSTWLTRELRTMGLPVVCIDARQAHRALSGRLNKSDAADAEGLAQLARTGWFREVHVKSLTSDRLRALLAARDRLMRIRKELEGQVRGTLKTFGIKLGPVGRGREREGFRHGHARWQATILRSTPLSQRSWLRTKLSVASSGCSTPCCNDRQEPTN